MRIKWLGFVAFVCAAALMSEGCQGCSNGNGEPDGGPPVVEDAGTDGGDEIPDAGPDLSCTSDADCQKFVGTVCDNVPTSSTFQQCVPACKIDDDCAHYNVGLRCNEASGHCIPAQGCNFNSDCAQCDPRQGKCPDDQLDYYCNTLSGVGCRCVTENNQGGYVGVCRRRRGICDECTQDEQCGGGFFPNPFEPPGRCLALQGDPNGQLPDGGVRRYCFYQERTCGCGMKPDVATSACIPQSGSCTNVGCTDDGDCAAGSVCNVAQCLCEPRCRWNFDRQELNPPGCHPSESCWVDPENLDPNSPYFGAGRCRPPCVSTEQCEAIDPRLECRGEPVAGGESNKRCRPKGECMDDFECDQPAGESEYVAYCDRETLKCVDDTCRIGIDPMTKQSFNDCKPGYKCENQNGVNKCVQQTCMEQGGARVGCTTGKHCCGEDRSGDGVPEPCPTAGIEPNNCYLAESPPFCITCQSDADCQNLPSTNGSILPNVCIGVAPPGGGQPIGVCGVATHNDFTLDSFGISLAHRGCPAKYEPQMIPVDCTSDEECDPPGAPGTGICDHDPAQPLPDGGFRLACLCTGTGTGDSTAGCPGDLDAGTQTYCKYAPVGATVACIRSVVCRPGGTIAFDDPSMGGCGIMP